MVREESGNKPLPGDQCFFKNSADMLKLFAEYTEAVANMQKVARQCTLR